MRFLFFYMNILNNKIFRNKFRLLALEYSNEILKFILPLINIKFLIGSL